MERQGGVWADGVPFGLSVSKLNSIYMIQENVGVVASADQGGRLQKGRTQPGAAAKGTRSLSKRYQINETVDREPRTNRQRGDKR